MTVGEDDGRELVLIVQEVTAVKVSDGNLMLTPEGECTKNKVYMSMGASSVNLN